MRPKSFMLIAGEASGDMLAAELVRALREQFAASDLVLTPDHQPLHASLEPRFFGAGGPRMGAAGVELAFDLTAHSVIGLAEAIRNYFKFRRLFYQLYHLALEREPDVIICVDFSGFNRRFAHAIRQFTRPRQDWFHDWNPKIVQYVSPQVWASREGRARQMARDYDLLLSLFAFEKDWYAARTPGFRVEFVGHPMIDRYAGSARARGLERGAKTPPTLLLLPGSRPGELARHLPVMLRALSLLRAEVPQLTARMILPDDSLILRAQQHGLPADVPIQAGGLPEALAGADLAIASTGTVTMECAFFGVPTVALYKTSWATFQIAKQIVQVKYAAMPNLLANEEIFPEFIQNSATPENLARAALALLRDPQRRPLIQTRLAKLVTTLGGPGASRRAAQAIVRLLAPPHSPLPDSPRPVAPR